MMNDTYYTTEEWEEAKPVSASFDKVYYRRTGEVRRVEGTVTTLKLCREKGTKEYKPIENKVMWDSKGRCTRGKGTRIRKWDMILAKL